MSDLRLYSLREDVEQDELQSVRRLLQRTQVELREALAENVRMKDQLAAARIALTDSTNRQGDDLEDAVPAPRPKRSKHPMTCLCETCMGFVGALRESLGEEPC